MSVITLAEGQRRARKLYRCQLCAARILPGDLYAYQENVYDCRAYTWRECLACSRDEVVGYVTDWCDPDDGVHYENANEWADEAMTWPRHYSPSGGYQPMLAAEHAAARNLLARQSVAAGVLTDE